MRVGEYLVYARLDCWILSQNCRNILPWHTAAQLVSAQKRDVAITGGDELCENLNPLQGLTFDGTTC